MKTKILFIAATFLTVNLGTAQVLYTENFNNLNTGNVGNDLTGTIPGQGSWKTRVLAQGNNTDFQIIPETNMGNILAIKAPECISINNLECGKRAIKDGLELLWKNRNQGNDVLKLEFDYFTGELPSNQLSSHYFNINVFSNNPLAGFNVNQLGFGAIGASVAWKRIDYDLGMGGGHNFLKDFPDRIWVSVPLYINFTTSQVYFEVPSEGIVHRYDLPFQLDMSIDPKTGFMYDSPRKIQIDVGSHWLTLHLQQQIVKFDNFKLSAVNATPTANIKDLISSKFNIFPNPATDIVTITNSENIMVEELIVYDTNGKIVKSQSINRESEVSLNIENLTSGTYLLHIKTKGGIAIKKVIKK